MNTVKFEIVKNTCQMKECFEIKEGCTLETDNIEDEVIESFDTLEKAEESLNSYRTSVSAVKGFYGSFYEVEEYQIQKTKYDEDGDFINSEGYFGSTAMEVSTINEDGEIIGTFNNFRDAELCARAYEDTHPDETAEVKCQ